MLDEIRSRKIEDLKKPEPVERARVPVKSDGPMSIADMLKEKLAKRAEAIEGSGSDGMHNDVWV